MFVASYHGEPSYFLELPKLTVALAYTKYELVEGFCTKVSLLVLNLNVCTMVWCVHVCSILPFVTAEFKHRKPLAALHSFKHAVNYH